MAYFLANEIKFFIEDGSDVHKLSLQSDFTFNRSGRVRNVSRESMDPQGDRSVIPIIENVGAIPFTFSTYAELDDTGAIVSSAQKLLWKGLLGSSTGLDEDTSRFLIQFGSSADVPTLNPLTFYIKYKSGDTTLKIIKLSDVYIDSVTIRIDLDSLVNLTWKGTALTYAKVASNPAATKDYTIHTNCMFTKYSTITILRNSVNYSLALTGGNIQINNNNVYYNKKEFGKAEKVAGHYTGSRVMSGTLDFYVKSGTDESFDLYHALMKDANTDTSTAYAYDLEQVADIQLILGDATTRHIQIDAPETVLNLPTQRYRNVVTMSVPFTVKESTGKEFEVRYIP